jgi:calcineurin-like phosphoesterase family protein
MWSIIGRFKHEIINAVADFRMINYKGESLSVEHFNQLHKKSFEFIKKVVSKEGKKIIITHHLPSNLCNAEEFRGSIYNDAFCVDKTDFIKHSNIDYWIYGHSHRNVGDIEINVTKMITNQLGYIAHGEQFAFERDRVIEI